MNTKEIIIECPEGYEVDKEKSTFEKIVFKKKEEEKITWDDLNLISGFYVNGNSDIGYTDSVVTTCSNRNIFKTKEQARAVIALSQLSQLIPEYIKRYYPENPTWKPDWNRSTNKYCIGLRRNELGLEIIYHQYHLCAFPTEEISARFFKEQRALLEQAKPFL